MTDELLLRVVRHALSVGPPFPRPLVLTEDERAALEAFMAEHTGVAA